MKSIHSIQCLSIIVCAGRSEVPGVSRDVSEAMVSSQRTPATATANIYLTIDVDNMVKPDIVGDLRTIHRQFHNNSIKLIVFRYCPLNIYSDKCISKWMQKLKPKGIMIFFGPLATDHFFQMLLKNQAVSSRRHFQQFIYKQCLVMQRL